VRPWRRAGRRPDAIGGFAFPAVDLAIALAEEHYFRRGRGIPVGISVGKLCISLGMAGAQATRLRPTTVRRCGG
jgi:hypothetical protein